MPTIEFSEPRNLGTFPLPRILGQRFTNQFRLRTPFPYRQLPEGNREVRIQINRRLCHLPYMVPYVGDFL